MRKESYLKSWKSLMLTLTFMLLSAGVVWAQNKHYTGTVKDQTGEPVIGASVMVQGTTSGTVTDYDGKFAFDGPAGKNLVVSYIGMKSQTIPIKGTTFNVTLQEDAQNIEEVVVIGYGTVKRKDITGSVASVSAETLSNIPVASATEAITGKLAGVQVTTTEGSPDAEMKIRVRGGGSITGDNSPLFIVDGFPVESINDIPPSDIESIDVLKDASSTAIYGSRGANGVIIVTTKNGKEGKITVNYNAYYSIKKNVKKLDVLSSGDYARWQYELALLKDDVKSYNTYFGNYQDIDMYNNVETNDWQDQVFGRTGHTFNHNLSINGGTDKTRYAFSYSYMDDKAIMQMSSFRRSNVSLKLNTKPIKPITLDFSVRYSDTDINGGGSIEQSTSASVSAESRLRHAMIYTPFPLQGLSDSGDDDTEVGSLYNPLVFLADNDRARSRKNLNMNGSVTWEIIKDLKLKAEVGLDEKWYNDNRFYGTTTYYVKNTVQASSQGKPAIIIAQDHRSSLRSTNTLNYDFKKLIKSKDHHLNAMIGQEYIITTEQTLTSKADGFPESFTSSDAWKLATQGNSSVTENYFYPDDKLLSFFTRWNYDYQSKYLLSATFRADGSSKFSEGNRWGYFPSAAAAWRISSEEFMQGTKEWLDDLKLRLSYGTAGNNNIPSGQMTQSYESKETAWINGFNSYWATSKTMANPDLKWETTITRNLGLDFTVLNSRLSGSVEAYLNTTKDLLILFPVSGTGYDNQYRNMGKTENKGIEATLNYIILDKKNYGLSVSANIGFNKNKIKSLGIMDDFGSESSWASSEIGVDYWTAVGSPVGQMYGYRNDGRYEVSDFEGYNATTKKWILKEGVADATGVVGTLRPGMMKLKDLDGDGVVGTDDREIIGDANPVHTGGFSITGRAYGFDLSANFNWSYATTSTTPTRLSTPQRRSISIATCSASCRKAAAGPTSQPTVRSATTRFSWPK